MMRMEDLRAIEERVRTIVDHYKWIIRAQEGWASPGLVEEGIADRIDRAYTELEKPEYRELMEALKIPLPDREKWKYFRK